MPYKDKEKQRAYQREAQRRYKERHPEKVKEREKKRVRNREKQSETLRNHRQKKKEWLNSLKGSTCSRCELEWPSFVLEFHHVDPSQKDFILAKCYSRSKERILCEIEKCVVLCANCHRIVEHEMRS
jgi:hypothetical protein